MSEVGYVCKRPQSQNRHDSVAQTNWSHQSLEAQRNAFERSGHRIPAFYRKGDGRCMWSLSVRQTTLTTVPEREEREQRNPGCSTFRCMGTSLDNNIWRFPVLCHVHRWLLQAPIYLSYAAKEWSVRTLPKVKKATSRKTKSKKPQVDMSNAVKDTSRAN